MRIQKFAVLALQAYIRKTSVLRSTRKVFITTQSPFRPIASMTLRRWILASLTDAGIDISKYAASTTRHASSSKAYYAGINIDAVMLRAGWTNVSSFITHYNLPIVQTSSSIKACQSMHACASVRQRPSRLLTTGSKCQSAKNIRASQLLMSAQKNRHKKSILLQEEAFVAPPPIVPRVQLKKPVTVTVKRTGFSHVPSKGNKPVQKTVRLQVSSWPQDQISKVYRNPVDHDDSDTE